MSALLPRLRRGSARVEESRALYAIVSARAERAIIAGLLLLLGALWVFPLVAALVKSLEVDGIQNYISLFTQPIAGISIPQTYLNSLIVGAIHAAIVVGVSLLAGFAFSKLQWVGREAVFALSLLFLAVPATALIVPVFSINRTLGLFNNFLGVGLPEAAITLPFGILIMRNFARNIPDALFEAVQLDGAGPFRAFRSVYLPLMRPAVVNLTVLCFVWSMQDFVWPSIMLRDPALTTAAQVVRSLSTGLGAGPGDIARYHAALVLLAVPAVLVVVFGMRFIVNGLAAGATKG